MISRENFPGKEEGENVVILVRRHWFTFLRRFLIFCVLAGLPIAFYYVFNDFASKLYDNTDELTSILAILGASVYYLFVWLFFFASWLDFYLDVWIVTNLRVISIEQHGLFARTVATQRMSRVQDVTSESKGIFATLFHYGNVYVQTAGEQTRFVFSQVHHPNKIAQEISALHKRWLHEHPREQERRYL